MPQLLVKLKPAMKILSNFTHKLLAWGKSQRENSKRDYPILPTNTSSEHLLRTDFDEKIRPKKITTSVRQHLKCPIFLLPTEIVCRILAAVDQVSVQCFGITCRCYRQFTRPRHDKCVRWAITCRLEKDILAKEEILPRRRACAFCKKRHTVTYFLLLPLTKPDHGFGSLRMYFCPVPTMRFCKIHIPKRLCYSPTFQDKAQENWARSLPRDKWIATTEPACGHCGERLMESSGRDKARCPSCVDECDVCGRVEMPMFSRYGPERKLRSLKNVMFYYSWMRRRLEIWDCNRDGFGPFLRIEGETVLIGARLLNVDAISESPATGKSM